MSWETGYALVQYGLRRANELSIEQNQDFVPDLKDYVNLAYWDIVGEFPWLWAIKYPPFQLTTRRTIKTQIVTVEGSSIVTLGADPGDILGTKLLLEGDGLPMRVLAQSGAVITTAAPYPRSMNGPGYIYQDEYEIPDDNLIPLELKSMARGYGVDPLTHDLFNAKFGLNTASSRPKAYTSLTDSVIQIAPWPMESETFELWYTYRPPALDFSNSAATDTPIVPLHLRWIIPDRALFYLLTDMEDAKAQLIIANSSTRLTQEKDRHAAKWRPQFWIPRQFRVARGR